MGGVHRATALRILSARADGEVFGSVFNGCSIFDRRIVSHEVGFVTFLAREGRTTGGSDEVEPMKLRGAEFVRSWSLHMLPKGYTKAELFYWMTGIPVVRPSNCLQQADSP